MATETILVVEDNRQLAKFIATILLPDLGYEAAIAHDGKSAKEILTTIQPSLMLLDFELPDTNGLDLLRQLVNEGRNIPTILFTAYGSEQVAVDAFRLGVQDYLIKPVNIEDLSASISRALTESRLRQETARLTAQLKEQVSYLNVLSRIGRSVTSTLDLDEVLRRITEAGVYLTQAEEGFLALIDDTSGQLYLRAVKNIDEEKIKTLRLPINDSLIGEVLHSGKPIRTRIKSGESRIKVSTGFLVQSLLHVPILSKGQPLGVFSVDHRVTDRAFSKRDETLLTSLADYAAVAIENANLYQQAQHEITERSRAELESVTRANQAEALARVAMRINQLDLTAILEAVCEEAVRVIPAMPQATMMLTDEQHDVLYIAASTGSSPEAVKQTLPVPRAWYEGMMETQGAVIVIPDAQKVPDLPNNELLARQGTRTIVSISLVHENELIGSLNIASTDEVYLPSDEELALLQALANQATAAIANARLFKQVSESRTHLQVLSQTLVKVQEAERRKLAVELHDEIGQVLTSLSLTLDLIGRTTGAELPREGAISNGLSQAQSLVNQLLKQVRDLSLDLRPALLDDLGLLPALISLFERYTTQTDIQVHFKHSGLEGRFAPEIETAAFRIIQEALTNVARYAQVNEVAVRLWANEEILGLQVQDQGVGFDPEAIDVSRPTSGLSGMRERANLCSGQVDIESELGSGTCLTAEFPLRSENGYLDPAGR